jgi:hypothetical protein
LTDAKIAASNTYAQVSAIPIVGPFLAPVAAAAAFVAVEAFDEGGRVTRGGPAIVHGGESVYTEKQTQRIEEAVGGGGSASHYHFHQAPGSSPDNVRQSTRAFVDQIRKAARQGLLTPA